MESVNKLSENTPLFFMKLNENPSNDKQSLKLNTIRIAFYQSDEFKAYPFYKPISSIL
jgi:hypothetical protein